MGTVTPGTPPMTPIRVLIIEDVKDDALLVMNQLRRNGYDPSFVRVERDDELASALRTQSWDIVIADYSLPDYSAPTALKLIRGIGLDIPVIIVSGAIGEDTAVAAMRAGANDYVMKDNLARLGLAVERELREAEVRRQKRQAEETLRKSREELRNLATHVERVRENERAQVARDIHDNLAQLLTALKMDLTHLSSQLGRDLPAAASIQAMTRLVDQASDSVHRVIMQLRPVMLDDLGLAAAVEWHALEFEKRTGIATSLDIVPSGDIELDVDRSMALYRILQEALTNVIRHAGAASIRIRLEQKPEEVLLEVEDDGRGITREQLTDSRAFGLIGMRERVLALNGVIDIAGGERAGTRISVRLPLDGRGEAPGAGTGGRTEP